MFVCKYYLLGHVDIEIEKTELDAWEFHKDTDKKINEYHCIILPDSCINRIVCQHIGR